MATLKPAKTQTASLTQCWEFLWKQGGQKCKLKMIDVVLFGEDGTPLRWLFTSKEGLIKRKSSASLKLPNVYKRFIHLGSDDPKNSKSIAAVAYLSDGEQVPVTGATLAEILLSGPRIGSLKRGGAIVALRGYIHPKGGHGSGFRNTFKVKDRDFKSYITATQRLLPLDEQVMANKKIVFRDLKSTATKLNQSLDEATYNMVKFLEDEQRMRCWYVEADYVIDHRDTVWLAHFEQVVYSKLKYRNTNSDFNRKNLSKRTEEGGHPDQTEPDHFKENKANYTHQSPSAEPAVPDKYQQSRLPTPGAFVCPGDFCDFDGENDDPNRNAGPWTTDKAIEKERQALQETISAYRRTMSQTSALGNAIAKTQENNEIDVVVERFAIMNKSILHAHEPNAIDYMSNEMKTWRERQALESKTLYNIEILSPEPGKSLSSAGPINIRWKNKGKIPYVRIQLYCGWAVSTIVTDGLPNEGFAVWRPDVQFRRKESENLKALVDAHVWRFKISCASRPWIYSFSKRFALRRSLAKIGHRLNSSQSEKSKNRTVKHELEIQLEEEEKVYAQNNMIASKSAANEETGINEPSGGASAFNAVNPNNSKVPGNPVMAGVLANAHPVDYYYREVEVCKNCYQCYTAMDRRREKGNRRQYKDKGGMRTVFAKRIERHKQRLEKEEDTGDDLRSSIIDDEIAQNSNAFPSMKSAKKYKKKKISQQHAGERLYNLRKTHGTKLTEKNAKTQQPHQNQQSSRRMRLDKQIRESLDDKKTLPSFGKEYKKFYNSHHPNPSSKFRPPSPIVQSVEDQKYSEDPGQFQVWSDSGDSDDEEEPLLESSRKAPTSNINNDYQSTPEGNGSRRHRYPQSATTRRSSEKKKDRNRQKRYGNDTNSLSPNRRSPINRAPHQIIANFVNRIVAFVWENFEGKVPDRGPLKEIDHTFVREVNQQLKVYLRRLQEGCNQDEGTSNVIAMCRVGTRFLMDTSYWKLAQDNINRCATIVCLAMDLVLLLGLTLEPYVPLLAEKLQQQLNVKATAKWIPKTFSSGIVPSGHELSQPQILHQDVPNESIDETRDRVKKRLVLAEKRRKKRELRKKRAEIDKKKLERGWGAGAIKGATKKRSIVPTNSVNSRRSEYSEMKAGSESPIYRPTFPGWGLNPTPTPRSKKREEMKERRRLQKQNQGEKSQKENTKSVASNVNRSATDLLNSPENTNFVGDRSTPRYIEKQMNAKFVDPPKMPRPDVESYSSIANSNATRDPREDIEQTRSGDFDFKSKSSLRQALWMGRSAIAKQSAVSQDIDVGFGSTNTKQKNEHKHKKKKRIKMSRSLPALDRPGPNVTPYLKRASLVDSKHSNSGGKKKRNGKSKGGVDDTVDLFNIGPMPRELHQRSGLRQVASLLVIGQLKDLRLIVDVAKTHGLRVLAHSRTEGDQLVLGVASVTAGNKKVPETPPKTAKLLRDFLNVATAFSEIFHLIDEEQSYLVCGAGELSHGLRQGSRSIQHLQVINRAVGSVERLKAWMSVGHSRGEILKGVAAWQTGQAGIAHHHWLKAIDEAVKRDGELAYDAAVARFLIGKHNQSASAYIAEHALDYLTKADSHFAKLGEGTEVELEAVRAEIDRVRGGRPSNPAQPMPTSTRDVTGHLIRKEMAASAEDIGAKEQVHFITRPPTAIRETLNWGRKSLDVIKRRLHSEKMLPIYHDANNDEIGGARAEQMNAKRQALAKAVVIAEGQLAALEAEVKSAMSTGSTDARPNSAMQFTMERKLIKLIDQVGVRAAELSEISNREKKYTKKQNQMKLASKDQEQSYDNDKLSVSHGKTVVAQQKLEVPNLSENIGEGKDLEKFDQGNKVPRFWAKKMLQQQLQNKQSQPSSQESQNQDNERKIQTVASEESKDLGGIQRNYIDTTEVKPRKEVPKEPAEQTSVPYLKTESNDPIVSAIAKAAHHSHIESAVHSSTSGSDLMSVLKNQIVESCSANNLGKFVQVMSTGIMKVNSIIDDEQNTAIHLASRKGAIEIVEYCCSHGGEQLIDSQNMEGNTALHYAYERKDMKMADLLMAHGANSHLKNMYGLKAMAGANPRSFRDFAAFAV